MEALTARGSQQATQSATTAQNNSAQQLGNANAISSLLVPQLESESANPTGFTPQDMAAMRTSAQQTAGGVNSGVVGQGALSAARTRNAGAPQAAIAQGARSAAQQLSQSNLQTDLADQQLKQKNRSQGISGLEGLYGSDLGAGDTSLGQVAPLVSANNQAINSSYDWANSIMDPILSAAGGAAGSIAKVCWIAESIYGTDDPRTHILRYWLNGPFCAKASGRVVMLAYRIAGRPVAWMARHSGTVRNSLRPLFDAALRKACA